MSAGRNKREKSAVRLRGSPCPAARLQLKIMYAEKRVLTKRACPSSPLKIVEKCIMNEWDKLAKNSSKRTMCNGNFGAIEERRKMRVRSHRERPAMRRHGRIVRVS